MGFIDLADQRRVSSCEITMQSGRPCTSIPSPSHRQHHSLDTSWAMHTGGAGAGVQGRPAGAAVPAGRRRDGAHGPRRAAEHPAPHGRLRCYAPPRGAEAVGGSSQSCTAVLLVSVLRLRPNGARHVEISQCAGRSLPLTRQRICWHRTPVFTKACLLGRVTQRCAGCCTHKVLLHRSTGSVRSTCSVLHVVTFNVPHHRAAADVGRPGDGGNRPGAGPLRAAHARRQVASGA